MIVVVGLGNIGAAMAECLLSSGQDVLGVDLSPERRAEWTAGTGRDAADSLNAVPWDTVDQVLVIVRLTEQAEAVLGHLDPLVRPGTPVFLSTTLELPYARELGRYDDRSWRLIELPVSGGQGGARAGTLTVMAAGRLEPADVALLESSIADHVVSFPRFGDPTLVKLLNNTLAGYNARAFAETIVLGRDLGVDPARLNEVLQTSSGASWMGAAFAVLVDDLLAKDVKLLWDELGSLPTVSLDPAAGLEARLAEARSMLITPA